MKISAINLQTGIKFNQEKLEINNQNQQIPTNLNKGLGYPKGFTPYFGARLLRTPENFYEQEFNKKGMPKTLRDYLNSNYEVNSKKPPMQLNQEAFADLLLCESIEDVKEMFPDEPLFHNLQTLQTIRPKQGYLRDLRMVDTKNNEVLSNGEDLTVYLLKKVYLEGKDIDEINNDFEKDMKPELKVENATKDGAYFLHTTLRSLGVYLPDKSYWASLQANRADKEYIPHVITVKTPRRKPVFTKPRVVKKPNLTPEERQRRRDMMINRWIEMSPAQRQSQLEKMREGLEDSIFYQYNVPIILIANNKAKFQDKMFQFFRENKEQLKTEAPEDLDNMNPKQAKAMKLFWEQNKRLRYSYHYHITSTIKEFEEAKEQGDEAIGALLNKAAIIRDRNEEKKIRRRLSNPELVKNELKNILSEQIELFPDMFSEKYMKFVIAHKKFNEEVIPLKIQYMFAKEEDLPLLQQKTQNSLDEIFKEFNTKNKRDSISSGIALSFVMRPFLTGIANRFKDNGDINTFIKIKNDADEMLTGGVACNLSMLRKYEFTGIQDTVRQSKDIINKVMKAYTQDFDEDELKRLTKNFIFYMGQIVQQGNYKMLGNNIIRKRCADKLPSTLKDIERNKDKRRAFTEFLKNYEGIIRYVEDLVISCRKSPNPDEAKLKEYENLTYYIYESIIDDYLM